MTTLNGKRFPYLPWQGSPGAHAFYILRRLTPPAWLEQPADDLEQFAKHGAHDLIFDTGRPKRWAYDRNAAYLTAAASTRLGVGEPAFYSSFEDVPGLWRFGATYENPWKLWEYTPTLRAESRMAATGGWDGWAFPSYHHVLRNWANYIRDWRASADPGSQERERAKLTYVVFFGMLGHKQERPQKNYIYRPDWQNMVIAENRARMRYYIDKVSMATGGLIPSAVKTDCIYYDRRVEVLPLGDGLGQFREYDLQEKEPPVSYDDYDPDEWEEKDDDY